MLFGFERDGIHRRKALVLIKLDAVTAVMRALCVHPVDEGISVVIGGFRENEGITAGEQRFGNTAVVKRAGHPHGAEAVPNERGHARKHYKYYGYNYTYSEPLFCVGLCHCTFWTTSESPSLYVYTVKPSYTSSPSSPLPRQLEA